MGHHIAPNGQFQSDEYPELPPDKIVLSFWDPAARVALAAYVVHAKDRELAEDIHTRLERIERGDLRQKVTDTEEGIVYVVVNNDWDAGEPHAVFRSAELADPHAKKLGSDYDVTVFKLDDPDWEEPREESGSAYEGKERRGGADRRATPNRSYTGHHRRTIGDRRSHGVD